MNSCDNTWESHGHRALEFAHGIETRFQAKKAALERNNQFPEHVSPSPRPRSAWEHAKHLTLSSKPSKQVPGSLAHCLPEGDFTLDVIYILKEDDGNKGEELQVGEACAMAQATRLGSSDVSGLSKKHNSPQLQNDGFASIEFYQDSNFLKVSRSRPPSLPPKNSHIRGEVKKFSEASRRRMMDTMAKIQLSEIPKFVTLTYSDDFPMYHERFKRDLDVLGKRILKRWPSAYIIWKLEFKRRKSGENIGKIAPHYHLFIYGVPWIFEKEEEKGRHYFITKTQEGDRVRWYEKITGKDGYLESTCSYLETEMNELPEYWKRQCDTLFDSFRKWIARNWYDIVGSNQLKHFKAGTRTEELKSQKGAYYYASKAYMGKTEDLSELDGSCPKPGRFWGIIGRKNLKLGERKILDIPVKQAIQIHRFIRRFRRANTLPQRRKFLKYDHYSAKVYCDVNGWINNIFQIIQI